MNRFEVGTISDRGLSPRRPINEDRMLALPERGLFLVADGVGGEQAGEVASQAVVDTFAEAIQRYQHRNSESELRAFIDHTITRINRDIFLSAQTRSEQQGMASTIALICVEDDHALIAHVGDSRVYTLSGSKLRRETRDHNDTEDAVRAGLLSEEDALNYSKSNIINRAVGAEHDIEPEFSRLDLSNVDLLLLCTDGITRHIPDDELREILLADLTPAQMCAELKRRCHERGAEDNLTAVIVKMLREDEERTLEPVRERGKSASQTAAQTATQTSTKTSAKPATKTSRIDVPVGSNGHANSYSQSNYGESAFIGDSSRGHSEHSLLNSALKMLVIALMLAAAYYAGIYVGRSSVPVNPAVSVDNGNNGNNGSAAANPSIDEEAKEWNYLKAGSQTNLEFKRALEAFDTGKYVEALKQFQDLVNKSDKSPTAARYHYWLARSHFALNSYELALAAFQKAIELNIGVPSVYLYQARCYQALGQQQLKLFNEKHKEFVEQPVSSSAR